MLYAQDVIVKHDGTTILAKVLTVQTDAVSYKDWGNLDGPTYTLRKAEITAINYKNGKKDVFSNLTNTPSQAIGYSQEQLEYAVNQATQKSTAGRGKIIGGSLLLALVGIPCVASGMAWCIITEEDYKVPGTVLGIGIAASSGGCGLIISGRSERRDYAMQHSSFKLNDIALKHCTISPTMDVFNNKQTRKHSFGGGLCLRF